MVGPGLVRLIEVIAGMWGRIQIPFRLKRRRGVPVSWPMFRYQLALSVWSD
jgi:hypothetical protein